MTSNQKIASSSLVVVDSVSFSPCLTYIGNGLLSFIYLLNFFRIYQWFRLTFRIDTTFYKFIFLFYLLPALLDKTCEWCYHWSQERYSCLILLTFPYRRKSPNCLLENSKPFKYHSIRFSCFNLLLVLVGRREKFFIDSGSHQIRWCSCNRKKADWKIDLSQHWCIGCLSSKNMFIFLYLAVEAISQWLQSIAD